MDGVEDRKSLPKASRAEASKSDGSGASREREARLAAALRANLRKRKAAPAERG